MASDPTWLALGPHLPWLNRPLLVLWEGHVFLADCLLGEMELPSGHRSRLIVLRDRSRTWNVERDPAEELPESFYQLQAQRRRNDLPLPPTGLLTRDDLVNTHGKTRTHPRKYGSIIDATPCGRYVLFKWGNKKNPKWYAITDISLHKPPAALTRFWEARAPVASSERPNKEASTS